MASSSSTGVVLGFAGVSVIPVMSSFSLTVPPAVIEHSVSHWLTTSNYLLWRSQFVPLHHAYDLMEIVDGSCPSPLPVEKVPVGDGGVCRMSVAYLH